MAAALVAASEWGKLTEDEGAGRHWLGHAGNGKGIGLYPIVMGSSRHF